MKILFYTALFLLLASQCQAADNCTKIRTNKTKDDKYVSDLGPWKYEEDDKCGNFFTTCFVKDKNSDDVRIEDADDSGETCDLKTCKPHTDAKLAQEGVVQCTCKGKCKAWWVGPTVIVGSILLLLVAIYLYGEMSLGNGFRKIGGLFGC